MHHTRWTNAKRVSQELSRALMTWRCAMMNGRAAMVTCHKANVTKPDSGMCCTNCFQAQANTVMLLTRSNSVVRVAHRHCMLKVPPRRIILLLSSGANLPARQLAAALSLQRHLKYSTNAFAKDMCRMCNTQYVQTNITSAHAHEQRGYTAGQVSKWYMDTRIWTNADTRKSNNRTADVRTQTYA